LTLYDSYILYGGNNFVNMEEETKNNERTYKSLWLNTHLCMMTDYKYHISTNAG